MRDYRACGDDRTITYGHAFHDQRAMADPNVITDANFRSHAALLIHWNINSIKLVICVANTYSRSNHAIFSNGYFIIKLNKAIFRNKTPLSEGKNSCAV